MGSNPVPTDGRMMDWFAESLFLARVLEIAFQERGVGAAAEIFEGDSITEEYALDLEEMNIKIK